MAKSKRVNSDGEEIHEVEAAIVDNLPNDPPIVTLRLDRSKKYIKQLMDMEAGTVFKFLDDQMATILMAANEKMLGCLEVLECDDNPLRRLEAANTMNVLINAVSKMSEAKIRLQVATGMDKLAMAGLARPKIYEKESESTPEGFAKKWAHLIPNGTPLVPDDKNVS